jgi:hypothetical protein
LEEFGGASCLYLQADFENETACSSEMMVSIHHTIQCHSTKPCYHNGSFASRFYLKNSTEEVFKLKQSESVPLMSKKKSNLNCVSAAMVNQQQNCTSGAMEMLHCMNRQLFVVSD